MIHKLWSIHSLIFFLLSFPQLRRQTTHVRINHAITSAVKTIPVLMEEHAPNCANTPNKSSTVHARLDMLENSVRKILLFLNLASSYNSRLRTQYNQMYTPCMIQQRRRCTKLSVISLLKLDSFGLYSSPSAFPTKTISRTRSFTRITQWTRTLSSGTSFACHCR